ncbi:hypothetical protein KXR87_17180 [Yokenella regensburgei]|uniref:hypothetical protein n=1 Tax=Yokenella regensburgei TaxID=158877 RepID=UPI003F15A3F0
MYKNAKESLVEIVIGDAILELLEADAPISHEALLGLLIRHCETETRETRRDALAAAIEEIRRTYSFSSDKRKGATQWGGDKNCGSDTLMHYLNNDPPTRGEKKH